MYQVAAAAFFTLVLTGSLFAIFLTVRAYWNEIRSALAGETPVRHTARPWTKSVRVTVRPRPVAARAAQQKHVAA